MIAKKKIRSNKKKCYNGAHVPITGQITLTSKLMLTNVLEWGDEYKKIEKLIQDEPIKLWNRIHNRKYGEKSVSLVRPAYASLKDKVRMLNPSLVEKVELQHKKHKTLSKIKKELTNGVYGTEKSKFKKISSRVVIK